MSRPEPLPDDIAPRMARAKVRRATAREVAELCLGHARDRKVGAPGAADGCSRRDPAEVCGALSRHIRLAVVLEGRIEKEVAALKPKPEPVTLTEREWDFALPPPPPNPPNGYRHKLHDTIYLVACGSSADEEQVRAVLRALEERLADGDYYDGFLDLSFDEAARAICKDLGLDWDLWAAGVARLEAEARAESEARPVFEVPYSYPPETASQQATVCI